MKRVLLGVVLGLMTGAASDAPAPHLAIAAMADLPVVERQPYNESADAEAVVAAAFARAKTSGKRVLIDLGGNWCGDCIVLANIMQLPEMKPFIKQHFEVVAVDVGRFDKNLQIPARFGITTLDLPTLHCWLRARVNNAWQPPTLLKVKPMKRPNPERISALIREVIGAHPEDYVSGEGWQDKAVAMLSSMVPPAYQGYLSELFRGLKDNDDQPMPREDSAEYDKARCKDATPPPKVDNKPGF